MEGALKIKEMCYLHAEGYSGGALKHGPFALIESDENGKQGATPIIMLILDDAHAHHMRTAAEEVKARGADVIVITDKAELADGIDENPLLIPSGYYNFDPTFQLWQLSASNPAGVASLVAGLSPFISSSHLKFKSSWRSLTP
eukprot:scaffold32118_cov77-Cyclotella_meneghiniana.AAC.1